MASIPPKPKKLMLLNFADTCCTGSHMGIGQWKRPTDNSRTKDSLDYYVWLAKTAERGKISSIFFADTYGFFDTYGHSVDSQLRGGSHTGTIDPCIVVAAMALASKSVSFAITGSTSYIRPFQLARTWSTLDLITNGRIGWNIVTSFGSDVAKQMGQKEEMGHDQRYEAAHEYMDLVYQLWEKCWEDGVQVWQAEPEMAYDPAKLHKIKYDGKYHQFEGYGQTHPTPQRTPVLFQAGASKSGVDFAGKHAEALYCGAPSIPPLREYTRSIREAAVHHGRDPYDIKCFASATPVIGRTVEEAQRKYQEAYDAVSWEGGLAAFCGYSGIDLTDFPLDEPFEVNLKEVTPATQGSLKTFKQLAGDKAWTPRDIGHAFAFGGFGPKPVGTPEMVADELEKWFHEADIDGFNLSYLSNPGSFEDVVDLLVPELQKRGIYWNDYPVPGGTARANMQVKVVGDKERVTDNILVPADPRLPMEHPSAKFKFNYEELLRKEEARSGVANVHLDGRSDIVGKGQQQPVVSTVELKV